MTITKAIIPVAGWGTRRLPITKSIEKCMLPVGNRPVVDYVVQDCIAAGIRDIFFVVSENSTQLHSFYGNNELLNDYLKAVGKDDMLPLIAPPDNVRFHYVVQSASDKYGTAVPVSLVADQIDEGESVVVLMGDDFLYNPDGSSEVARLMMATPSGDCSMLGVTVPRDQVGRYGVLALNDKDEFVRIVEKPLPEEAPSDLINVSKYILNDRAIKMIAEYVKQVKDGEYYITDPINDYVDSGEKVHVVRAEGQYLDGGSVEGWLYANNVVVGRP
jgi:UTP--glucose-1-phosphate uridylyltransferase